MTLLTNLIVQLFLLLSTQRCFPSEFSLSIRKHLSVRLCLACLLNHIYCIHNILVNMLIIHTVIAILFQTQRDSLLPPYLMAILD